MRPYQKYSDAQLLQLLSDNDEEAFTEIYNRYWEQLVDTGYYFTKDKQSVEEIVNDVFMRLWKKPGSFQIRSLREYLTTSVKFGVFKALLKIKRRQALLKNYTAPILSIEEEQRIEAKFTESYINAIIEEMPEKSKLIYKYSRENGMNTADISKKMKVGRKTIEYHITKTLKVLRNSINL